MLRTREKREIEELRRQVKDLTEKYGSMAQNTLSDVKEKVQQNMGDVEQQIRDKPVQASPDRGWRGLPGRRSPEPLKR